MSLPSVQHTAEDTYRPSLGCYDPHLLHLLIQAWAGAGQKAVILTTKQLDVRRSGCAGGCSDVSDGGIHDYTGALFPVMEYTIYTRTECQPHCLIQ